MELKAYNINLQIYAKSEEEAERGRKAIIHFINVMRDRQVAVTGEKIVDAIGKLSSSPFVFNEIVKFFKN